MKSPLLLLLFITLFTSCDKRGCECKSDMRIEWKDGMEAEGVWILLPNAVENTGHSFAMAIEKYSLDQQEVNWSLDYVKVFKENAIFVDTDETESFVRDSRIIRISHDVFLFDVIGLIRGPISFEFHISFPDDNTEAVVEGTVFYYDFQETMMDFNADDCRWPCQVIGDNGYGC